MAYKKPEVVAKSESKQSFVGGCPTNKAGGGRCTYRSYCEVGQKS